MNKIIKFIGLCSIISSLVMMLYIELVVIFKGVIILIEPNPYILIIELILTIIGFLIIPIIVKTMIEEW